MRGGTTRATSGIKLSLYEKGELNHHAPPILVARQNRAGRETELMILPNTRYTWYTAAQKKKNAVEINSLSGVALRVRRQQAQQAQQSALQSHCGRCSMGMKTHDNWPLFVVLLARLAVSVAVKSKRGGSGTRVGVVNGVGCGKWFVPGRALLTCSYLLQVLGGSPFTIGMCLRITSGLPSAKAAQLFTGSPTAGS